MTIRQKYFLRNLRRESFQDYDAIIFVVDSADRNSFDEARQELWNFLRLLEDFNRLESNTYLLEAKVRTIFFYIKNAN